MVFATFFFIHSLQKFDLVDIYVVFFSAPLIVSILTALFLKDILSSKGIILMLLSFGCIIYSMSPSMKVYKFRLNFSFGTTSMLGFISIFYKIYFW